MIGKTLGPIIKQGFPSSTLNVGTSVQRSDAFDKVTGAEVYAADYYGEDLVWAGVARAGVPHARIQGLHTQAAKELSGVIAVLTASDVSGTNRQGVVRKDQPVLVDDKVRHCGDAMALVIAEDRDTLNAAVNLIKADFEPLPGVFTMSDALKDGAPLIHESLPGGNVLLKGDIQTGMGDGAFEECDVIVEACFNTPLQEHAYLETEVGWARVEEDGRLTIVTSTQTPFRDRMETAEALGLEPERVRIIVPYVGGAFGGKDGVTVQTLVGLAALNAGGRPVKMWWDREESFIASTKRHAARLHYRLGAKKDGSLHALNARLYFDTGPYDHLGGVVMTLALEHAGGPYRIPNADLKAWCVHTNNPIGGAFRAFGVTQVTAAMEQLIDMVAEKLRMDPIEIRKRNAVRRGDKTCIGVTLTGSTGFMECLETVSAHPLWKAGETWKNAAGSFKKRGIGVAGLMHAAGYGPVVPDYANAKLELTPAGRIRVYSGVVDMGQGNSSTYLQIAGTILGQELDGMELVLPDTDHTLPSGSASASRCTFTFGNALIEASEKMKQRILERAADMLMAEGIADLAVLPGRVKHLGTGYELAFSRIAQFMNESERFVTSRFRAPTARDKITDDALLRLHGLGHTLISYGAHLALVEVDEITGLVEVADYLSVTDCGTVINPRIYEQQIHGAIAQGLGYALTEDLSTDQGRLRVVSLRDYGVPRALDCPEIQAVAVEIHERTGPFGLKGIGEIGTNGPLPAVANAVADACGIRVFHPPLTPERVLRAIDGGTA
jgi:CO/xanthine dehydrogenase Mo-binding subunit